MRIFRHIVCILAIGVPAFLCGCREPLVVDGFEATLRILNRDAVLNSGDALRWAVDCNHEEYKLVSVAMDARVETSFPAVGREYSSGEEFSHAVTVFSTHRGTLTVVVQDLVTGKSVTLTALYTAYDSAELRLEMMTDVLDEGGAVVFRVYSRHDTFEIVSFSCGFDFPGVTAGMTVNVGPSGYAEFSTGAVHVLQTGVYTLKVKVRDPESGEEAELSKSFQARRPTVVSVSVVDADGKEKDVIADGEDFIVRIYDTQESFVCEEVDCEFDNNLFRVGSTYKVGYDGYYQARVNKVAVGTEHNGRFYLVISDPVFGKKHRLEYSYKAVPAAE